MLSDGVALRGERALERGDAVAQRRLAAAARLDAGARFLVGGGRSLRQLRELGAQSQFLVAAGDARLECLPPRGGEAAPLDREELSERRELLRLLTPKLVELARHLLALRLSLLRQRMSSPSRCASRAASCARLHSSRRALRLRVAARRAQLLRARGAEPVDLGAQVAQLRAVAGTQRVDLALVDGRAQREVGVRARERPWRRAARSRAPRP